MPTTAVSQSPRSSSPLQEALASVPQSIRHWFGSERITYLIADINRKLNITDDRRSIIPRLLLRLEVQDLEPQRFVDELQKELSVSREPAVSLAKELDEKILRPIKKELFDWGVDIDLLDFGRGAGETARGTAPAEPPKETAAAEQPVPVRREAVTPPAPTGGQVSESKPAPISQPAPKAPEPVMPIRPAAPAPTKIHPLDFARGKPSALGEAPASPVAPAAPAPFMLHKEETFAPIMESKQVQIQREAAPRSETGKATAVRLEMTGLEEEKKKKEGVVAKTEVPQQRVVHYSAFRTPINPFGKEAAAPAAPASPAAPAPRPAPVEAKTEAPKPAMQPREEVIDLSTFQRAPALQPKPTAQPSQPKLDGNVVDLRGRE